MEEIVEKMKKRLDEQTMEALFGPMTVVCDNAYPGHDRTVLTVAKLLEARKDLENELNRSFQIDIEPRLAETGAEVLNRIRYMYPMTMIVPPTPTWLIRDVIDCGGGPYRPAKRIKYQDRKCWKRNCVHMAPRGNNWCRVHQIKVKFS